jgi:hypothetical protein
VDGYSTGYILVLELVAKKVVVSFQFCQFFCSHLAAEEVSQE